MTTFACALAAIVAVIAMLALFAAIAIWLASTLFPVPPLLKSIHGERCECPACEWDRRVT